MKVNHSGDGKTEWFGMHVHHEVEEFLRTNAKLLITVPCGLPIISKHKAKHLVSSKRNLEPALRHPAISQIYCDVDAIDSLEDWVASQKALHGFVRAIPTKDGAFLAIPPTGYEGGKRWLRTYFEAVSGRVRLFGEEDYLSSYDGWHYCPINISGLDAAVEREPSNHIAHYLRNMVNEWLEAETLHPIPHFLRPDTSVSHFQFMIGMHELMELARLSTRDTALAMLCDDVMNNVEGTCYFVSIEVATVFRCEIKLKQHKLPSMTNCLEAAVVELLSDAASNRSCDVDFFRKLWLDDDMNVSIEEVGLDGDVGELKLLDLLRGYGIDKLQANSADGADHYSFESPVKELWSDEKKRKLPYCYSVQLCNIDSREPIVDDYKHIAARLGIDVGLHLG